MSLRPSSVPAAPAFFTMIEMTLVLVVMFILLAMAMPTLRGTLKANRVNAAASQVSQAVRLARQYAVAHACHVAVLMPTAEDYHRGGVDPTGYKASSLRLCRLTGPPAERHEGSQAWYEGTFREYLSDSAWEFLPPGTYIGYTSNFGTFTQDPDGSVLTARSCNVVSGVLFPDEFSSTSVSNLRAIIFRPNGTVVPAMDNNPSMSVSPSPLVRVGTGIIRGGDQLLREDSNAVIFEVNRFTGRVKFVDGVE